MQTRCKEIRLDYFFFVKCGLIQQFLDTVLELPDGIADEVQDAFDTLEQLRDRVTLAETAELAVGGIKVQHLVELLGQTAAVGGIFRCAADDGDLHRLDLVDGHGDEVSGVRADLLHGPGELVGEQRADHRGGEIIGALEQLRGQRHGLGDLALWHLDGVLHPGEDGGGTGKVL